MTKKAIARVAPLGGVGREGGLGRGGLGRAEGGGGKQGREDQGLDGVHLKGPRADCAFLRMGACAWREGQSGSP